LGELERNARQGKRRAVHTDLLLLRLFDENLNHGRMWWHAAIMGFVQQNWRSVHRE
jgi:hypothetical protein